MTAASTAPTGFRIAFPPGWSRFLVDDEGKWTLVKRMSVRMKELGRPDFDAEARTLVEVQWRRLKAARVTAVYLPGESEEASLPASIAVRQHVSQGGRDFHASVRAMSDGAGVTLDTPVGQITRWQ